ncbi:MAG: hypothetical protein IPK53_03395 [bacterium]|nr:hypothetical protein [bacterium]
MDKQLFWKRISGLILLALLLGVMIFNRQRPFLQAANQPGAPAACPIFPADHIWNTARRHPCPSISLSNAYIAAIGLDTTFHPDFGSGDWPPGSGNLIGIPLHRRRRRPAHSAHRLHRLRQRKRPRPLSHPARRAPVEGGSDHHVRVVDDANCVLYRLYNAVRIGGGTSWEADSGAQFNLAGYTLRPAGWTSADAAGLPIFPGLVRYDEVQSGEIKHALRFTAPRTQNSYLWPARHFAGSDDLPYRRWVCACV